MAVVGKFLSSDDIKQNRQHIAKYIDSVLDEEGFGFVVMNMYKKDHKDRTSDYGFWGETLNLPPDFDLSSKVWMTNVVAKLGKGDVHVPLSESLGLCEHFGLHALIVPFDLVQENLCGFCSWIDANPKAQLRLLILFERVTDISVLERELQHHYVHVAKRIQYAAALSAETIDEPWSHESIDMFIFEEDLSPEYYKIVKHAVYNSVPSVLCGDDLEFELQAFTAVTRFLKTKTEAERLCDAFNDVLQDPLQPLKDNLCSQIYETFEEDAVKYEQYELAMVKALKDLLLVKTGSALKIAVLGAGRGPLVSRLLDALEPLDISPAQILVVDKNPYGMITLSLKLNFDWSKRAGGRFAESLKLVPGDMRSEDIFQGARYDLIVSELLGGFGDNELSPECLETAEKHLEEDGIMIPHSYTSWIEPVYAPRVRKNLLNMNSAKAWETPYTCRIHAARYPCEPVRVFTFSHPSIASLPGIGSLEANLAFEAAESKIDGFAGYFSCILYDKITLSTVRGQATPAMYSWFSMFFPVKTCTELPVKLTFSRKWDTDKVWYSWTVHVNGQQPVLHNEHGHSSSVLKPRI